MLCRVACRADRAFVFATLSAEVKTGRFAGRCFQSLSDAIKNVHENPWRGGEIELEVDTIAQAHFLNSEMLGIAVLVRAEAPSAIVERTAEVALSHVAKPRRLNERRRSASEKVAP